MTHSADPKTIKLSQEKRMFSQLNINLTTMTPLAGLAKRIIDSIRSILDELKPFSQEYLDCQEAWTIPHLPFPYPVKYNDDAMKLIAEKVLTGKARVFGVSDWDAVGKGKNGKTAFIRIRVLCERVPTTHEFGYSISMHFHPEISEILYKHGIVSKIEELACAVSAEYGWIDFHGFDFGSSLWTNIMTVTKRVHFPEEHDLTGLIPCVAWWTLLSEQHISRLGGKDAVIRQAPCYAVHDLSTGDSELLGLQITSNPTDMDDSHYRTMYDYLKPVIPPVNVYALAVQLKGCRIPGNQFQLIATEEELEQARSLLALPTKELSEKAME